MTAVRKLEIRIDQTGDARKGIANISGSVGKIANIGLAAGTAAVTGVAALTAGVVLLGSKLVGLGSDAEEMEGKFNVVFGDAAPDAAKQLDEFGNAVGRNKYDLMGMASTVQDTFVPLGFARDQASEMSVGLTQLAVDVGSFNNSLETDVMADFQSAVVGNHETVRKYGIIITQATLDQELLRMGVEGGVKAATEQEKVQARLNLIYAGTTDAQGDAARTSGSWANQMRMLKSELAEAATTMGKELLPILTPILKEFTVWIKDIMPKAIKIFQEFTADFMEKVGPAMEMIKDAISRISEAFGVNTEEVSTTDAILWVFKETLDTITNVLSAVAIVFHTVADGVEAAKRAIDRLKDAWNTMKEAARRAIDAIPDWLRPGSPTPFELGLKGIAEAAGKINLNMGVSPLAAGVVGGAGGRGIVLNLTYAPIISLADRYEAQEKLTPFILEALRREGY